MEKYTLLNEIGRGAYGIVHKAQNKETKEIVAIKQMIQEYESWEECINLRELKSLRKLIHPNIVKLKEVFRVKKQLSFVFEYVDQNIYKLYESAKSLGATTLPESTIKLIVYQIASALAYMHKHGFFHRDLKPENMLISSSTRIVKIIDLGLVREIRSRPPFTDYVSTRWYRAPELLLRSTNYNSPVDIFALGCIMAELYLMKPLFTGANEIDQLSKISAVLGTPSKTDWQDGFILASQKYITFPSYPTVAWSSVIPNCPTEALNLISEMIKWDPHKRITANKILTHPYFANFELPEQITAAAAAAVSSAEQQEQNFQQQQQQQQQQKQPLNVLVSKANMTHEPLEKKGQQNPSAMVQQQNSRSPIDNLNGKRTFDQKPTPQAFNSVTTTIGSSQNKDYDPLLELLNNDLNLGPSSTQIQEKQSQYPSRIPSNLLTEQPTRLVKYPSRSNIDAEIENIEQEILGTHLPTRANKHTQQQFPQQMQQQQQNYYNSNNNNYTQQYSSAISNDWKYPNDSSTAPTSYPSIGRTNNTNNINIQHGAGGHNPPNHTSNNHSGSTFSDIYRFDAMQTKPSAYTQQSQQLPQQPAQSYKPNAGIYNFANVLPNPNNNLRKI